MRWSEAETLEFVKIYLDHEVLWNPEHTYYKSRRHREKAYANVLARFRGSTTKTLTILEVKKKIRNLRTTYQQQIQKILQKSNPDSIFEPTLVWFNVMDRCLKNISNRQPSLPMKQETSEIDIAPQMCVDKDQDHSNEDPLSGHSDDDDRDSKAYPFHKSNSIRQHKKIKKKKLKRQTPRNKKFRVPAPSEDEFDMYGKYIAEQLRKINLKRALQIKLEIQRILSEARISNLYGC